MKTPPPNQVRLSTCFTGTRVSTLLEDWDEGVIPIRSDTSRFSREPSIGPVDGIPQHPDWSATIHAATVIGVNFLSEAIHSAQEFPKAPECNR